MRACMFGLVRSWPCDVVRVCVHERGCGPERVNESAREEGHWHAPRALLRSELDNNGGRGDELARQRYITRAFLELGLHLHPRTQLPTGLIIL